MTNLQHSPGSPQRQTARQTGRQTARSVAVHFFFFVAACSIPYVLGHWRDYGWSTAGLVVGILLWAILAGVEEAIQPARPKTVIHHDTRWRRSGIWALLSVLPAAALDARFVPLLFLSGLFMATAGIILRIWSLATLGPQFTWTAGVVKNHVVVKHGPYRFFRHPNYIGSLLFASGIAVLTGSLFAWLPVLVLLICVLVSARHETKFLRSYLPGYR